MGWFQTEKARYILIAAIVVVVIAVITLSISIGVKENPKYTSYSCSTLFSSNEKLEKDMEIKVTSTRACTQTSRT